VLLPNFTFNQPLHIVLNYSQADLGLINDESALILYRLNGATWLDAAKTCTPASVYQRDLVNNHLEISICHLTEFALLGPVPVQPTYLPILVK
jgi:hypothetical protein